MYGMQISQTMPYKLFALIVAYSATLFVPTAAYAKEQANRNAKASALSAAAVLPLTGGNTQIRLKNFKTKSRISPTGGLVIESFSGNFAGGQIAGIGRVDLSDKSGPQNIKVQLKNVNLAELASLVNLPIGSVLPGRVSGSVNVNWIGMGYHDIRRTLSGNASLHFGSSQIAGLGALQKLADFTGLPQMKELAFQSGSARIQISGGVLTVADLKFSGASQQFTASGKMDLDTEEVEGRIQFAVSRELAAASSREFIREAVQKSISDEALVNIPVPLNLKGQLGELSTEADLSGVSFRTAISLATESWKKPESKSREPVAPSISKEQKPKMMQVVRGMFGG
jgi:uncharacterized protein YhdP